MRDRTREMLHVLARSTKAFSETDLENLSRDLHRADWIEVLDAYKLAKSKKVAAAPKAAKDPFTAAIEKDRRKIDLPAADALRGLLDHLSTSHPSELGRLTASQKKAFGPALKALRAHIRDTEIRAAFDAVAQAHVQQFSTKYDLRS